MNRHVILGLCGVAMLLAAVNIGSGQAPARARAAESQPGGKAKERSFRLRVTTRPAQTGLSSEEPAKYLFEKTYTALSTDKGKALPPVILGSAHAIVYYITIDWPDNPNPDPRVRSYDYQVSKMTSPAKDKKPPKDKLYLGKGNLQLLALTNKKEGDELIKEAVALIVKDVTFRMSFWDEVKKP